MRWCIPLAVMVLCVSCTPTPFDLTLSRSAQTVTELTQDNASAITMESDSDSSFSNIAFYPTVGSAGFDYGTGMVTYTEGRYAEVEAVGPSSDGESWTVYSRWSQEIINPDAHAPSCMAWPVKGGSPYLFCIAFDALYPEDDNLYCILSYDAANSYFSTTESGSMSTLATSLLGASATVIGASVTANPSSAYDMTHWLTRDGAGTRYVELAGLVGGSSLQGPTVPTPRGATPYALSFLPEDLTRCMYYYDENPEADSARSPSRSFVSWYDESSAQWKCWAWWEETAGVISSEELPITYRVDALLSNGQLLSMEDETARLYDRDGNLLAAFPLGNLVYIGEQYVDGAARTYFSQCLDYDGELHFFVYWILTSALPTLAE